MALLIWLVIGLGLGIFDGQVQKCNGEDVAGSILVGSLAAIASGYGTTWIRGSGLDNLEPSSMVVAFMGGLTALLARRVVGALSRR
jgi:hypothetical protein